MATFQNASQVILAQTASENLIELHGANNAQQDFNTNTGKKLTVSVTGAGFDIEVEDGNIETPSFEMIFDKGKFNLEASIMEGEGGDNQFVLAIIGTDSIRDGIFGPENNEFLIDMQESPIYIKTEGDKVIVRQERLRPTGNNS